MPAVDHSSETGSGRGLGVGAAGRAGAWDAGRSGRGLMRLGTRDDGPPGLGRPRSHPGPGEPLGICLARQHWSAHVRPPSVCPSSTNSRSRCLFSYSS